MKKRISGTGCCLLDYLYADSDFTSPSFRALLSRQGGDGGLVPGKLVFASDLAGFAGKSEDECLAFLTGGLSPDTVNLGGPGIVAMAHAAQILREDGWELLFSGVLGDDTGSETLREFIREFPLDFRERIFSGQVVPSTTVLSDPRYLRGAGERTFINRLGVADAFDPSALDDRFFNASLYLWGGTALVPPLHRNLTSLLQKARRSGGINIVGTVYDFLNESLAPHAPWPLGDPEEPAYPWIDLLITDLEEAYRLSGASDLEGAVRYFKDSGCAGFIITRGAAPLFLFSSGGVFRPHSGLFLPSSPYVDADLAARPERKGDTTGCGDNFMGGVLVSLARQSASLPEWEERSLDLVRAAVEGICSGGLALYTVGGCRKEAYPGEKADLLEPIRQDYLTNTLPEVKR